MFVCNMKLNFKFLAKVVLIIFFIIMSILVVVGIYKVFFDKKVTVKDNVEEEKVIELNSNNYTSMLKEIHNNLDKYIGKEVKITGFVYRLYDFSSSQFVIAREMIVSKDYQAVIVGFLCNLNESTKYKDNQWITIKGKITKGNYHGEIPIIDVEEINETTTPSDEYVYPPDNANYCNI